MNDAPDSATPNWPIIAVILAIVGIGSIAFFALSGAPKPPAPPERTPHVVEDVGHWEPFPTVDAGAPDAAQDAE